MIRNLIIPFLVIAQLIGLLLYMIGGKDCYSCDMYYFISEKWYCSTFLILFCCFKTKTHLDKLFLFLAFLHSFILGAFYFYDFIYNKNSSSELIVITILFLSVIIATPIISQIKKIFSYIKK